MNYILSRLKSKAFKQKAYPAISKLKKAYKCLVLGIACMFLFSCTKSVTVPDNAPASTVKAFRLKQVDIDNHVSYSEVIILN
jgi:hypothetical protein